MKYQLFILLFICLVSCKEQKTNTSTPSEAITVPVAYAKGFEIEKTDSITYITIKNPWPEATKTYRYALVKNDNDRKISEENKELDGIISIPVKNLVVTSTTHIPSIEMLGDIEKIVGFPNLKYISSPAVRERIDAGKIRELGKNEAINTEVLIDLNPSVVVGFGIDNNNTTFSTIQKTGIPVIYNGDWTEQHPLGKAEWIKFFGALLGKETEASTIFKTIETDYNNAKLAAKTVTKKPTVLSGAMYKDVWYLPQGDSWAAQFIAEANGDYLWKDTKGTGSLSLNLEAVLEKGKTAEIWLGPGHFTSIQELTDSHQLYTAFDAFKNKQIYSFTAKKGATGGVLYYELAPNRPDLVLKDIIKILHPEVLPDHELYFFTPLE